MRILLRIWPMFTLAARRLLSQRGLALATLLGLVSSVSLVMSIPMYTDASYYRILREELYSGTPHNETSPFTFMFHYLGSWAGPLQWEDVEPADSYLTGQVTSDLGLQKQLMVRSIKTGRFVLFPQGTVDYKNVRAHLAGVSFGSITDLKDHITILDGSFPTVASPSPDGIVDVLLSESLANEVGFQIGETYIAFAPRGEKRIQIPVRIAATWQAVDSSEMFWFRAPGALTDVLLVPEETFHGRLSRQMDDEVYDAVWYLVTDGSRIRTGDVGHLLGRIRRVETKVSLLLPGMILRSVAESMERYQRSARLVTTVLYAFSIPIIALNLVFTGLVTRMVVDGRKREIATLLSRGASRSQMVGAAIIEGLLIGLPALALSLPTSWRIARLIGQTRTFLSFAAHTEVPIAVTKESLVAGLVAIGFGLVTRVTPTMGATRHTIVSYKQERARLLRAPWWQRVGLDLLLLIPGVYGTYLLKQRGSLFLPVDELAGNDPFRNPLLLLVPSIMAVSLALSILRILPLIMKAISWIASRTRSVAFLLAARQLSRTAGSYAAPAMLLVMTFSLSAFISSTAQTLDKDMYDKTRYRAGAEMVLMPELEAPETEGYGEEPGLLAASAQIPRWFFVPPSDYLGVPGIQQVTRVAKLRGSPVIDAPVKGSAFMGIDRLGFSQVAFWRPDFAAKSLGALMNALATCRNGVLVPRSFMRKHSLAIGDSLRMTVKAYGQQAELDLKIVGDFDLFPTWNPVWGPLFVGNLDYLFEQVGGQLPAPIWIMLDANSDPERIRADLSRLNPHMVIWGPSYGEIEAQRRRPERQGLFGILSVGFMSASLLSAIGFFLYALSSFQRRLIELGALRAIGLSNWQMASCVLWESTFLMVVGLVGGTILGLMIGQLAIPHFNVPTEASTLVLPLSIQPAWPAMFRIYGLFGLVLAIVLGVSTTVLRRAKLFQIVKLVEEA